MTLAIVHGATRNNIYLLTYPETTVLGMKPHVGILTMLVYLNIAFGSRIAAIIAVNTSRNRFTPLFSLRCHSRFGV